MRTSPFFLSATVSALLSGAALASFDFGSECSEGSGSFEQYIRRSALETVGTVPVGKRNVVISLDADADVDIQLIDAATGHEIIAWPSGDLAGPTEDCTTYRGVTYCYSGYNGVDGDLGNEWIEVRGDTNRELVMKAFGYGAGTAIVDYAWEAIPTCWEVGSGEFDQYIPVNTTVEVGDIPATSEIVNLYIELDATSDVDVQLHAGTTEIIGWPNGLLSGADEQSVTFEGMQITYSGYNGIDGDWGREFIRVSGPVTEALTMKAFGYQAGSADVTYSWGEGAGDTCGGIAALTCDDGLTCKNVDTGVADAAGTCHTEQWCDAETAATDCDGLFHPMVVGAWGCEAFRCTWVPSCDSNEDCADGFCGWDAQSNRVCKPWGEEGDRCNGRVLPDFRNFCDPALACIQSDPTGDIPGVCTDLICSLANMDCPSGYTCALDCPSGGNCGINPPGTCVAL